ncbi:cation diffusion facilitator family transporter [Rhodopseudomonas pseudopalustris]|uniref:cation diffusion facilitator family transporter n=1 Tax=Rhodopseudomonas pseudopalustris TaxID=1513892 RepID=UPI003F99A299
MHGGGSTGTAGARHARRLALALALTATYMVAEVVGGLVTGSLALLADAAHMLTDVGGLALALLAIRFAAREPTSVRTFGYLRMEVLAAMANAVVLLMLTVYILYEAYQRFLSPPEVLSGPMLLVAAIGLVVNLASMFLLKGGSSESLNVKGAYFEVLSDMLGSIGVIVAALLMMWKGWSLADPLIGAGIGLFIVPRTWSLLSQVIHILMQGTPPNIDLPTVEDRLMSVPGVLGVHDLHVWTVTSNFDVMTCHLLVTDLALSRETIRAARRIMRDDFGVQHTTIQIDDEALKAEEAELHV